MSLSWLWCDMTAELPQTPVTRPSSCHGPRQTLSPLRLLHNNTKVTKTEASWLMSTSTKQSVSTVCGLGLAYGYCTRTAGTLHSSTGPLHGEAHTMETAPCPILRLSDRLPRCLEVTGVLGMQMEPLAVSCLELLLYRTKKVNYSD